MPETRRWVNWNRLGLTNSTLNGTYNAISIGVFLANDQDTHVQTHDFGVASVLIPLTFNGGGTRTEGSHTGEMMILSEEASYPENTPKIDLNSINQELS